MNMRSEVSRQVQSRLASGESKSAIYQALKTTFNAASVERSLAQWPLPAVKRANRQMNVPLIIIAVFFTLLRIVSATALFGSLAPAQLAEFGLMVIIHIYTVYGVIHCNLIGYMLITLMALNNLMNIFRIGFSDPKILMVLALSVAAVVLALIQKRRLFPNTSWFLRHKRDAEGNPIF